MKTVLTFTCIYLAIICQGQQYPDPEFSNEVYWFSKDSANKLLRLEKESSKMDTRTKMGGFGGAESGYSIEGVKSQVRLPRAMMLHFVFSKNNSSIAQTPGMDSMMKANGMDPAMMESIENMHDPSNSITLYKTETSKENRKILLQKSPGAMSFGNKKTKSSDKYTFSVKKVRNGYWELVVDKPLPAGEYAFVTMNMGASNMDGSVTLFAFGID
jgi:hypothetical protein